MSQSQRIEQNIDFYKSHLKHIDELLERSSKGVTKSPEHAEIHTQIAELRNERDQFAKHIDTLELGSTADMQEQMIEGAGPMGVWDALAQQLEKLVERIES
jgi:lipid II:glycine glycyltransferase (peptidoglycan interpeptide bridge formation enzyme)